jgi:hypothetical protein
MSDFTTDRSARLDNLRGALLAAAAVDLAGAELPSAASGLARGEGSPAAAPSRPDALPRPARPARRLRFAPARGRLALALLVLALALPGVAIGTGMLSPNQAAANGLPAGSTVMTATQPTCTALREGVEYRCVFAVAPGRGGVLQTVEPSGKVDGGCRSQNEVATLWICYFGAAAVHQQVVSQVAL